MTRSCSCSAAAVMAFVLADGVRAQGPITPDANGRQRDTVKVTGCLQGRRPNCRAIGADDRSELLVTIATRSGGSRPDREFPRYARIMTQELCRLRLAQRCEPSMLALSTVA
jgi:hypothetical protein